MKPDSSMLTALRELDRDDIDIFLAIDEAPDLARRLEREPGAIHDPELLKRLYLVWQDDHSEFFFMLRDEKIGEITIVELHRLFCELWGNRFSS
jgi:hypothetical protein